jgi:hypothetical protein
VIALDDGLAVFGAWNLILQVAGKCKQRGLLTADTGRPLTAQDIAMKTGAPAAVIERALQVLASEEVGWLLVAEWENTTATGQDRTGQGICCANSSAEFGRNGQPAAASTEFVFPTTGKGRQEWTLSQSKMDEYVAAYPGLDVVAEMRKARQWCRDKSRQRKTARGMPAFLTGWLNRAQNRGAGRNAPETNGEYESVTPEEFQRLFKAGQFRQKPTRHSTKPSCWYGTLKDGRKVECQSESTHA